MAAARRGRVPASRVLLVACFGAFLAFLDATIVNVAFPSIRASFPGDVDRVAVLGAERLQHRLRRVPDRLRPAHRPARTPSGVPGRHRAVHRRVRALRCRAVARPADRRPGRAGARCGDAGARLARPGRRGLPGTERGRTPSGCGARPRPWRPGSARRSAAPWSSWAAGAGRSWSTSRSASRPLLAGRSQLVESRAPGRRRMPDLRRRRAARGRPGAAQPGRSSRAATGAGAAPPWSGRSPRPLSCWSCSCLSSRRHRSPLLDPALLRIPLVLDRLGRHGRRRPRLLRLPADQHPVAAVRLGVRRAAGRSGPGARRAGRRRRRRAARARWPTGTATGRSSCPARWSGPAPTSGTTSRSGSSPAFWARVAARPGAQRHRRRRHPPAAGQRRARRRPRRPVRHRLGRGVQRPPARRRARHRDPRRHPRRPDPGHCRRGLPRRLGAVDRRLPGRRGGRAAAGPAALGAGRRRTSTDGARRPRSAAPTRRRPPSTARPSTGRRPTCPTCRCSRRCPTRRQAAARGSRPGASRRRRRRG